MQTVNFHRLGLLWAMFALGFDDANVAFAQTLKNDILTPAEWKNIDQSVDRALQWLAAQQQSDGSFATLPQGQPAVTSLCIMAFAAHGHTPGVGKYGTQTHAGIKYVLSLQKPNGLLSLAGPRGKINPRRVSATIGIPASYNHAMATLVLTQIYGAGAGTLTEDTQKAVEKAIKFGLEMQLWPKARKVDNGGWRYLATYDQYNADLSISGWHLMALRSAKDTGFDVPKEPIDRAVEFIRRCYLHKKKRFGYFPNTEDPSHFTRGMQGAGILALSHAGVNNSFEATQAANWLLKNPFTEYAVLKGGSVNSRYHYGLFLCTLAMHQMGDPYWQNFFPSAINSLLLGQQPNGSWPPEAQRDTNYGNCYTTAMALLTLATPNELLPIFQR